MSVLLTDEAVRNAVALSTTREGAARQLVRHHATEGREALEAVVRGVIATSLDNDYTADQEVAAIVTALFGEPS